MRRARRIIGAVLAFCNLVGGQDELIFDGGSLIVDQEGRVLARSPRFEEDLLVADVDVEAVFRNRLHDSRRRKEKRDVSSPVAIDLPDLKPKSVCLSPSERPDFPRPDERLKNIYDALVLGTRDYVVKNGFEKVFIGLFWRD